MRITMGNDNLTTDELKIVIKTQADVINQNSAELHEQDETINTQFWCLGFCAVVILSLIVLIIYK